MTSIGIVGSRTFNNYAYMRYRFLQIITENNISEKIQIVSGGAVGADNCAEQLARELGFSIKIYKPNWETHGRSAGFIRNQKIVDASDLVIAFWDGKSKGTFDTIKRTKAAGKKVFIERFKVEEK